MNRSRFFLGGLLGPLLASSLLAQSGLRYENPVYAENFPDPTVIRTDEGYVAFGTTGQGRLPDGRIFTTISSPDLVDWKLHGGALIPPSDDPQLNYWAPEICEQDGTYFLYYSQGDTSTMDFKLRVATSQTPTGPYRDTGAHLKDPDGANFTIDGFPFRDDDGQWYFFYAKDFVDTNDGHRTGTGIAVARMENMTRLVGESRMVVRARHDWTLFLDNRLMPMYGNKRYEWHTVEGPYVVKHEGKYYCFYSGANYGTERYGLDYVVADSPMGPYRGQGEYARVLRGVPNLVRGPGHHGMTTAPDGRTMVLYHAWDEAMKRRQLNIDPLAWTEAGPVVVGPSVGPVVLPAPSR